MGALSASAKGKGRGETLLGADASRSDLLLRSISIEADAEELVFQLKVMDREGLQSVSKTRVTVNRINQGGRF